jgi:hypothetical protein
MNSSRSVKLTVPDLNIQASRLKELTGREETKEVFSFVWLDTTQDSVRLRRRGAKAVPLDNHSLNGIGSVENWGPHLLAIKYAYNFLSLIQTGIFGEITVHFVYDVRRCSYIDFADEVSVITLYLQTIG